VVFVEIGYLVCGVDRATGNTPVKVNTSDNFSYLLYCFEYA